MRDNLTIIKELVTSLNMEQLIALKSVIDVQVMSSSLNAFMSRVEVMLNTNAQKSIPAVKDIPQNIPPEAKPKTVWKASGEKWAGRDAKRDEEGWTFAENDPELSSFLADSGDPIVRVDLDGIYFDVKFSGTDRKFLNRNLPKDK